MLRQQAFPWLALECLLESVVVRAGDSGQSLITSRSAAYQRLGLTSFGFGTTRLPHQTATHDHLGRQQSAVWLEVPDTQEPDRDLQPPCDINHLNATK